jgi:hypothetical protein
MMLSRHSWQATSWPVASALGVSPEGGSYELAALLSAMVERLPSAAGTSVVWAGQARGFAQATEAVVAFRTAPGALCRLYILYEETDACNALGERGKWVAADAEGNVSWDWHPDPASGGPVTALLRVRLDQAEYWHSFSLIVSD